MTKLLFILTTLTLFSTNALAAEAINTLGVSSGFFSSPRPSGTAVKGYDTVAYFTQNKAVKGSTKFSTKWKGAAWQFSSQKNLDLFKKNPEKYAPQYGGYCAYGVAKGNLVKIEPDQFSILNKKLYLNYDSSIKNKWEPKRTHYIKIADQKFPDLL